MFYLADGIAAGSTLDRSRAVISKKRKTGDSKGSNCGEVGVVLCVPVCLYSIVQSHETPKQS